MNIPKTPKKIPACPAETSPPAELPQFQDLQEQQVEREALAAASPPPPAAAIVAGVVSTLRRTAEEQIAAAILEHADRSAELRERYRSVVVRTVSVRLQLLRDLSSPAYLAELAADPALLPASPADQAHARARAAKRAAARNQLEAERATLEELQAEYNDDRDAGATTLVFPSWLIQRNERLARGEFVGAARRQQEMEVAARRIAEEERRVTAQRTAFFEEQQRIRANLERPEQRLAAENARLRAELDQAQRGAA